MLPFVFILLWTVTFVSGQQNVFYNPPPGGPIHNYTLDAVYAMGDTVKVQWSTSYTNLSLVLWQNDNPDYEYLLQMVPQQDSFTWKVATNQDLSKGVVFFLSVYDETSNNQDFFSSHYFNLTQKNTSASSTATTATSATTTSQTAAATSTGAVASSSSGLSTGAKIGIGVAIPLAAIIGLGASWWFFTRRRHRSGRRQLADTSNQYPPYTPYEDSARAPLQGTMVEAPGEAMHYELPSYTSDPQMKKPVSELPSS